MMVIGTPPKFNIMELVSFTARALKELPPIDAYMAGEGTLADWPLHGKPANTHDSPSDTVSTTRL